MLNSITSPRSHFLILSVTWALLQAFLLRQYGIVTDLEATKYIEQADYFLQTGGYQTGNFLFYSTQILLIALARKAGTGYWLVVAVQMLVNAISLCCFYRLAARFTGGAKKAFLYTAALLGMYYYQLYNVYLFTESLYFSFSIIFFYGLFSLQRFSLKAVFLLAIGLTILYLTRPVGIFFIPATFLYVVLRFYPRRAKLLLATAGVLGMGAFILLLNKSLNSGGELDFLLPYLDERVICGVPTISTPHQISLPVEQDSVQGLLYIITHHWKLFAGLSARRLVTFFGVIRPYYSFGHNLFIAAYFCLMYLAILVGIRKWSKANRPQIVFILSLLFFTATTTALSCDEWHNRFILAILPFLLLLASLAFSNTYKSKATDDSGKAV